MKTPSGRHKDRAAVGASETEPVPAEPEAVRIDMGQVRELSAVKVKDVDERAAGDATTSGPPGMRRIPSATTLMGSEDFYPEERPVHRVVVDGFWMDAHPVTVAAPSSIQTSILTCSWRARSCSGRPPVR